LASSARVSAAFFAAVERLRASAARWRLRVAAAFWAVVERFVAAAVRLVAVRLAAVRRVVVVLVGLCSAMIILF
jgi:hypothetical protein